MIIKVDCKKHRNGACLDLRMNRNYAGLGARLCTQVDKIKNDCRYQEPFPRPNQPPPPPSPPSKRILCEDIRLPEYKRRK